MKSIEFAKRNVKEILRDPLSIMFCFLFPVVMILVFQLIAKYSEGTYWFEPNFLIPGMTVFSLSFVMLFMTILVSKDKTTSFLSRLYVSPMKTTDFLLGYIIPGVVIAIIQAIICQVAGYIVALCTNHTFDVLRGLLSIPALIIPMLMFVSLGILFGILFTDKSAPGITSILITASGFLGGAWMPLDQMGDFATTCEYLPFYPITLLARNIVLNNPMNIKNIIVILVYTSIIFVTSIIVFKKVSTSDTK